jgi:hypothetical protein
MSKKKYKGRIQGPFVPIHKTTIESPAWKALSLGARCLFVELSGEAENCHNIAWLSERDAAKRLGSSRYRVREWFAELEHHLLLFKVSEACLGVDGRGKSAHWRINDRGTTKGGYESPTQDFLKWGGTPFDAAPHRAKRRKWNADKVKKQNPGPHGVTRVVPTGLPGLDTTGLPGSGLSGADGVTIETGERGAHGVTITSLTTGGCPEVVSSPLESTSKPSLPQIDRRLETNFLRRRH